MNKWGPKLERFTAKVGHQTWAGTARNLRWEAAFPPSSAVSTRTGSQMESATSAAVLPGHHGAVAFRTVSDGAILLHTEDEVYYGLNAVGVRVWQLLPESPDLDGLCGALLLEYPDVAPAELRADVTELLDALGRAGLVVPRT